jgi:uncharacterized protein
MLPIIEQLLVLQDRDRRLIRLRAELADVPLQRKRLQDRAALTGAAHEAAKLRGRQIESDRKKLELEVQSKQDFIRKIETQQGATKSNDEYKRYTHQIETTHGEINALEDRELVLMEQAETVAKEIAAAAVVAAAQKAESDKQLADLAARQANLEKDLAAVSAERAEQAAKIDEPVLGRYDRILKTKGDNVVVGVANATCGGCHMKLPQQVFLAAKAQTEIVTCSSCGRMLYYTRDMEA